MEHHQICSYLAARYGVDTDQVLTGATANEEQAGLYHGENDAWVVYGRMPNSTTIGWFFAGYSQDITRDIARQQG